MKPEQFRLYLHPYKLRIVKIECLVQRIQCSRVLVNTHPRQSHHARRISGAAKRGRGYDGFCRDENQLQGSWVLPVVVRGRNSGVKERGSRAKPIPNGLRTSHGGSHPMIRPIAIAAVVILAVTHIQAAGSDVVYQAGRQALSRGEYEKAVDLFEKAVALQPNNSVFHYQLGGAYGQLATRSSVFKQPGLARKAKNSLERAVELDGNNTNARFGLIDFYMIAPGVMGGSESKALAQAAEIRKRDSLDGHRAQARIYQRQKKMELARAEMIAAVREQPASRKAHYHYALFLFVEKNFKGATEEFESAIKLDASWMPSYFRLGQTAAMAGNNFARGEEALKQYLTHTPGEEDPPLARAWYWLGRIYEQQGKKAEAKQSYAKSLKLTPGAKEVMEAMKRVS